MVHPTSNVILERIIQVLGNLVRNFNITQTYVDKGDPWSVILDVSAFSIISTTNSLKVYSPGQLLFGRDMILPMKHKVDWGLILQRKQTRINKDDIRKNIIRVDYHYKVVYKFMVNNHYAYKYKTPYKGPCVIK